MEKLNIYLFHRNDRVQRIKLNSNIAVRHFQNRRWQFITFLEQLSGLWPYQRKLKRYPLQLIYIFFHVTIISSVTNKLTKCVGVDTDMTIECCLFMFYLFGLFVKFFSISIQQFYRRKIYEKVAESFETISDPEEAAILNKAAEKGFRYNLYYMSSICIVITIFSGCPILRSFYRYVFNDSELDVQLPVPMDFGLDHRKYWYIIAVDFITWACTGTLIGFTCELSLTLKVRHVEALFKIVGIRLRKASALVDENENIKMSDDAANRSYSLISSAIDLHSECFEIIKLIEKSFSTSWFMILLMSTAGFGGGIHMISTKLHDPVEAFRYVLFFMIILLHFYQIFSQGQTIIDSAESVSDACCECKWYGLPKKSRQLLSMMMIRASMPCSLTGAKLFPLSMESFSKMLKAGLSYYTVFETQS